MSAVKIHHTQSVSRNHSPASSRRNSFDSDAVDSPAGSGGAGPSSGLPSRSYTPVSSHHHHHSYFHHASSSSAASMGAHHRPAFVHASSSLVQPKAHRPHSSLGAVSMLPLQSSYPSRRDDSQAIASAIDPDERPHHDHADYDHDHYHTNPHPSSSSTLLFSAACPEKDHAYTADAATTAENSHPLANSVSGAHAAYPDPSDLRGGAFASPLSQKFIDEHSIEGGGDPLLRGFSRVGDAARATHYGYERGGGSISSSSIYHSRDHESGGAMSGFAGGFQDALAVKSKELRTKIMGKGQDGIGRALVLGWVITTLGFVVATAFWRGQLFSALDRLSKQLFALGLEGKLIFGFLIFMTTIPPLPLYSTLMVLAGYTFGVWEGFVVSYIASITGAVLIFVVSRSVLKDAISKMLAGSPTAQSLLQILPANPHLLLLIRIAPYPYNLLNVILASAPTLSLRTYTACTAFSLLKLVLHTWIGAGIHDISATYAHGHPSTTLSPGEDGDDTATGEAGWGDAAQPDAGYANGEHAWHRLDDRPGRFRQGYGGYRHHHHHHHHPPQGGAPPAWMIEEMHRQKVRMYSTWVGIALCVALFFYLTHLAKKALAKAQAEAEERDEELALRD